MLGAPPEFTSPITEDICSEVGVLMFRWFQIDQVVINCTTVIETQQKRLGSGGTSSQNAPDAFRSFLECIRNRQLGVNARSASDAFVPIWSAISSVRRQLTFDIDKLDHVPWSGIQPMSVGGGPDISAILSLKEISYYAAHAILVVRSSLLGRGSRGALPPMPPIPSLLFAYSSPEFPLSHHTSEQRAPIVDYPL